MTPSLSMSEQIWTFVEYFDLLHKELSHLKLLC